jgi:hypothetical protein
MGPLMSQLLYGLLSAKLDEIAALYNVRPRITLIVRMPGKPDECAFLSDDAWPDAVATVERLYGDKTAFSAGPAEPLPSLPAPPAGDGVREDAEELLREIADEMCIVYYMETECRKARPDKPVKWCVTCRARAWLDAAKGGAR